MPPGRGASPPGKQRGGRPPLLTYLKLQQEQAVARGNLPDQARLERRIRLVEERLLPPPK
jgi:hypothetical protein